MYKMLDKKYFAEVKSLCEALREEKEEVGEILNSPYFEDLIFEDNFKETIKLILEKIKKERLNLLFYGTQGTGKTTTAKMLACETGKPFIYINGNMTKTKITNLILNAKNNALVLIDEIHSLPSKVAEIIYPCIQDNEIYVDGERKKLNLMFIGTTTEPELLPKPLIERFIQIEFSELSNDKMKEVLIKRGCSEEIANYLLNYTTNFRVLNNLLNMIKLYGEINKESLIKVFRLKKISLYSGLSDLQEKYLDILKNLKRASLRTLSLYLKKSENYIKYELEPDLIRKNYILITSRGRELNPEFADYSYEELKKESEKEHSEKTLDEIELAKQYLEDNPHIKEKFKNKYFELIQFIADKIVEGISPDEIDFYSFSNDCSIEESFKNNYLEDL